MVVVSEPWLREVLNNVRSEILEDESYTLTSLDRAVEICISGNAPVSASFYREVMKEKISRFLSQE